MERLKDLQHYQQNLKNRSLWILYTTTENCSVCHSDLPKVKKIADQLDVPVFNLESEEHPLLVGQLNLFSVPTVIVYFEGKEMHRQVRIIDFEKFGYRLEQLVENT